MCHREIENVKSHKNKVLCVYSIDHCVPLIEIAYLLDERNVMMSGEEAAIENDCTNQRLPQRGGVLPDPIWVGLKWLLAFPRVPDTPGTHPCANPFFSRADLR